MNYEEVLEKIEEIKTETEKGKNTAEKVGSAMKGIASLIGTRIVTLDVSDAVNNIKSGKWELGVDYDFSEFNFGMSAEEFMKLFEEEALFCIKCDISQEGLVIHTKFMSNYAYGYPADFGQFQLSMSPIKTYLAGEDANTLNCVLMFMGNASDFKGVIAVENL